jgi:hypothetical protein
MIYNSRLTTIGDRKSVLSYLKFLKDNKKDLTVVDVGASANHWSMEFVTHVVDYYPSKIKAIQFNGNISDVMVWNEVLDYVKKNGKFDFLVSTHTIEDISAAPMVCGMFSRVAKEGFIAIPSKYIELSRHEGPWRGFIHHRWIYDMENDSF